MAPKRAMRIAQQLYEGVTIGKGKSAELVGLVTYIRTDSTRLSADAIAEVRAHIEARFIEDMTWDNWGRGWGGRREWHLDHVRPLASFDLTDPAQLALACHYTNLQPLWAIDNLKKGAIHGRSLSGESES